MAKRFPRIADLLFRNAGTPNGNLIALLFGGTSAVLLLSGRIFTTGGNAVIFSLALVATLLLFVLVSAFRGTYKFAWGPLTIGVLGFGFGTLVYQYRDWWKWLWGQLRRINEPHEFVLTALFLIGVMLGVFVVRNWAKEQKAFVESLSAILSGTFVAGILAKLFDNQPGMSQKAFAYYALGFAISGTINLIFAAWLTARYTNRRSIPSRAILDFMYGTERAETIDKYFLKNFEEDPDYAKRWLTSTLLEFRKRALQGFAERMERRRKARQKDQKEGNPIWHYYELVAIMHEENKTKAELSEQGEKREHKYKVVYKPLDKLPGQSGLGHPIASPPGNAGWPVSRRPITDEMFRIGISIKKADFLEYIVAPGEYHAAFPRAGSVLGLALEMRHTIVMDRDRDRKFRNKDHKDGISPGEVEQSRGVDEIDFLSYVSIPVVSRLGESTENALGVLNIDTKIFVSLVPLYGRSESRDEGTYWLPMTRTAMTEMASNLYDDDDDALKYLEEMKEIVRPILELYARCRVGAT
jgi:hypothetical protein